MCSSRLAAVRITPPPYAQYVLGVRHHLPVALAAPSLYTIYKAAPVLHDTLVLAISQSGMSPDIVAVVENARSQGMLTVAITNAPESRLALASEYMILCRAGEERSIAATKTYTGELMAVALLSAALAGGGADLESLRTVPEMVHRACELGEAAAARAERYRYMENAAVLGRGFNLATALEAALKLKELTYIGANPYSSADYMHGPMAIVQSGFPVLVAAPSGLVFPDMVLLLRELEKRGAELLVISDQAQALDYARTPLPLPEGLPEWLSPIIAVIPGQLLAHHLALAKGIDPTKPRGLQKITETR